MMGSTGSEMDIKAPPSLCQNGCGFFGTAATGGLCSKCYRDLRAKNDAAGSAVEKLVSNPIFDYRATDPGRESSTPATDLRDKPETTPIFKWAVGLTDSAGVAPPPPTNRCRSCQRKVGVVGFDCRCGHTFCGTHRYPETHDCTFDFKGKGRNDIAMANPVIKPDKVQRF